jgi:hypothetical protein
MFYEMKPFACLGLGLFATVKYNHSMVALASGIILVGCGALVLKYRYDARSFVAKRINRKR